MTQFTTLPLDTNRKPIVSIVGAGIAGLTLAILLQKQGLEFNVFERAKEIRPLAVTSLFKQMGIYDEFVEVSKMCHGIDVYNDRREFDYNMDFRPLVEMGGAQGYVTSRSALYDLLLRQLPKERVYLDKKVVSTVQNERGVIITTCDNRTHESDILIGADGAYSVVRQGLYNDLKAKGELPASDDVPLPFTCVCLVGQTNKLDPKVFPVLEMDSAQFWSVLGDGTPCSWNIITSKQDTICWQATLFLEKESSKANDTFLNAEWGPEAAEAMCKDVYDFAIPGAAPGAKPLTMGDVIDNTPNERISKVMLEEKVFDTWHAGRTALIGDACHKVNPAGGQGGMLAIHDAVCVANWISALRSTKLEDVEQIFDEYKKERLPIAKQAFESSQMFRNFGGKNLLSWAMRLFSKHMPVWLWRAILA